MSEIANSVNGVNTAGPDDGALELRLFRTMIFSVIGAVMVATFLASWRVSSGLMLGGGLSLLNFHWLSTSVGAILSVAAVQKPRVRISRYFIRYFIVGIVVFAAYQLHLVSLPATIAGLCAFVPALFAEASRQFYFAIFNREESF